MLRFVAGLCFVVLPVIGAGAGVEGAMRDPGAGQEARVEGVDLRVDYERSVLVAKLKKAGLLRFLGHEHGVMPGAWTASVRFDENDPAASRIEVDIDTAALVIDTDEARRLAGVDPDGPSAEDRTQISVTMLSDTQLDAAAFPAIRFTSSSLTLRASDELRIDGTLEVRGVRRDVRVDASLDREAGDYVVRGDFEIELRDFGIEPVSIGGVVKVANEVEIRFEIYASPSSPAR